MDFKPGDIVVRISYEKDVYFKIVSIDPRTKTARLKGLDLRLYADAPLDDLCRPGVVELANYRVKSLRLRVTMVAKANRNNRSLRDSGKKKSKPSYIDLPGKVLHLDGDPEYLQTCQKAYDDLQIENNCYFVSEVEQPRRVESLLREHKPDILVLTGHDGMVRKSSIRNKDGERNYHNTRHFIAAVAVARDYQPSKDDLVIFAGACQSWYQGLLEAGANFASSPQRVFIHALDPVLVVEKVAYTPVGRVVSIYDALTSSVTGLKGVGGIETKGQFRLGLPKI